MELIEGDEMACFRRVLSDKSLDVADFELREVDVTDPKTDEIEALQGLVTVLRKSTRATRQYRLGDKTEWVGHFQRDLNDGVFGS